MKFLFDIRRASLPLCFAVLSSAAWAACTGTENGDDDDDSSGAAGSGTGGSSAGGTGGSGTGAGTGGGAGAGGGGSGQDPLSAAPTCTSNQTALPCEAEGDDDRLPADSPGCEAKELMNPGRACITCHSTTGGKAPDFVFGGTVFATGHEPDLCKGGPQSSDTVQIVITDANGDEHTATANAVGNFFLERQDIADFAFPLTAKVVYQGRERAMSSAQDTGDCNSCHTQGGDNYAPGRITLPLDPGATPTRQGVAKAASVFDPPKTSPRPRRVLQNARGDGTQAKQGVSERLG